MNKIYASAAELVLKAGQFIRQESLHSNDIVIEEKDRNSLVSYVDKQAEQMLVEGLLKLIPDAGLITEEDTTDITGREWEWIIDPLDGTTNFLHDIPAYSVSVGLRHNEQLVMGFVYEVNRAELFSALKGDGAKMNNRAIHISKRAPLANALMATGFPYTDFSGINAYMDSLRHLMQCCRGLRRMGSAAVDLAYVANGRFDGFFEHGLNPWDVAGGIIIIQEAGGLVSDFGGTDNYLFGRQIIASSPQIHQELLDCVGKRFLEH